MNPDRKDEDRRFRELVDDVLPLQRVDRSLLYAIKGVFDFLLSKDERKYCTKIGVLRAKASCWPASPDPDILVQCICEEISEAVGVSFSFQTIVGLSDLKALDTQNGSRADARAAQAKLSIDASTFASLRRLESLLFPERLDAF